jgi:hypothetical protein
LKTLLFRVSQQLSQTDLKTSHFNQETMITDFENIFFFSNQDVMITDFETSQFKEV